MQKQVLTTSFTKHTDAVPHGEFKTGSQSVVPELAALATTGNNFSLLCTFYHRGKRETSLK